MGTRYENSLFYQINSSAKYFDMLFEQFFKELNLGLSAKEHLALSIIQDTKDCCQRDLAKVLLKDRANTGKLAKKLEDKGLVKIETKIKNNKPVKILTTTKKAQKLCDDVSIKIKPFIDKIKNEVSQDEINEMIEKLINFRRVVKKAVKINI